MARTVDVSLVGVTGSQEGLHRVTLKLRYLEDGTQAELINKDFTQDHKQGQGSATVINKFEGDMQSEIDFYKSSEAIANHASMATAISDLESNLVV
jgi:hypothetical protein